MINHHQCIKVNIFCPQHRPALIQVLRIFYLLGHYEPHLNIDTVIVSGKSRPRVGYKKRKKLKGKFRYCIIV